MTLPLALAPALDEALRTGELGRFTDAVPRDRRDRVDVLQTVYDLHTAPLAVLGERARHQHHPAVSALKNRLEAEWLAELPDVPEEFADEPDVVTALRAMATVDRLPRTYHWLADEASWDELVRFLAMEGGPDAGFDDLVAACQVGLYGSAKLELAQNYWDEMGNGDLDRVHTVLHDRLVAAIGMPRLSRAELPLEALERTALGGLLATNRWLQPEMIGALGMIELQAGPRCRKVVQGLERLGAPAAAYPFYTEHAEVDPRHGKDWVEKAVVPLVAEHPSWQQRILRGAWWRLELSLRFFSAAEELLLREASHAA
ncbi:MAG: iron-containing redox enzyme family protein [Streptomyces sp.]|uniref:iron-containing redox enzyme family protein n=1 Tax=Streptomyces sp. TaxID=1931 RepID=UPI0025ECD3A4|nr:iron-containing redox enzyme family protein [Streptomyces sp.]MBW8801470.1 iron-containing redox enzyme family protein [Streptomyces sp.]